MLGAKLVFGLNVMVCRPPPAGEPDTHTAAGKNACRGRPWDPTEAKALMKYLIQANHTVYGFELGNVMALSSSLRTSTETFCMLNRQRELTLRRPTAAPTATSSAYV